MTSFLPSQSSCREELAKAPHSRTQEFPAASESETRGDGQPFVRLIEEFRLFGHPSVQVWEGPIRYLINEFWTSGQRQAHSIHEVSYRACFKPQLPEFFIQRLTKPGDAVYDPFMGRGTTPVQAALMGRQPIGNDINPLSVLLTRPRLAPPGLREVGRRLDQITWGEGEIDDLELTAFYSPRTLRHICALRGWLTERLPQIALQTRSTTGSEWWRSTD